MNTQTIASDFSLAYTVSHNFLGRGSCNIVVAVADMVLSAADFVGEHDSSFVIFSRLLLFSSSFGSVLAATSPASPISNEDSCFFRLEDSLLQPFLFLIFSWSSDPDGGGTKSCLLIKDKITVGSELDRERWYEMATERLQNILKSISCVCLECASPVTKPPYAKPISIPTARTDLTRQ